MRKKITLTHRGQHWVIQFSVQNETCICILFCYVFFFSFVVCHFENLLLFFVVVCLFCCLCRSTMNFMSNSISMLLLLSFFFLYAFLFTSSFSHVSRIQYGSFRLISCIHFITSRISHVSFCLLLMSLEIVTHFPSF